MNAHTLTHPARAIGNASWMIENRGMPSTLNPEQWPPTPRWFRGINVLDRVAFVVSLLAAAVELVRVLSAGPNAGGLTALAVTVAGVVVSRFHTWPGLLLVAAGSVTSALWSDPSADPTVYWTIAVFTLFSVTVRGRAGIPSGVVTGLLVYASVLYADKVGFTDPAATIALATSLAAAACGAALRGHQNYWLALEQRTADAVATRESEANRRVAEERVRIARDLHDVVGHEVAVIGMHLGVAEVSLPAGDSAARAALESARASVRRVLHETQLILAVLRHEGDDDDEARPTPDIAQIPALVETFRAAGLVIDTVIDQDTGALDPTVSLAAYRIVQEALTNAQRHGRGPVELQIRCNEEHLTVSAANDRDNRDISGGGSGYGLVGMHERVRSAGGQLSIDDDGRRFCVTAVLKREGGIIG
jgi:signal transduction histidine kinase